MEFNKTKAYLLFVGIGLIIIIPITTIIYNNIQEDKLYKNGVKTSAIIKDSERGRNPRTRTFNYSLTLSYFDDQGKSRIKEIQVNYEEYRNNPVGESTEILMNLEKPSEIILLNTAKYYDTEERVIRPTDLKNFLQSQDKEYILSKLNKISAGWTIKENDSSIYMNKKRRCFINLKGDSITYFGNMKYKHELLRYINGLKVSEYGEYDPGYLTEIPFKKIPEPRQKIRGPRRYQKYIFDDYELMIFNQIDYSHKDWLILSAKKIVIKH